MTEYWIPVKIFIQHNNVNRAIELLLESLREDGYEVELSIEGMCKPIRK